VSNIELRSVSRDLNDVNTGLGYPTRGQVIGDGIPVPFTRPRDAWYSWVEYASGTIVTYEGMPYYAKKGSTGITPPTNGIANNEWQPIGYDNRIALMMSGYTGQNLSLAGDLQYAVTPYVLWFDESGALITKLTVRAPATGNTPANIVFDSFAQPSNWGTALVTPDIGTYTWAAEVSNFVGNALTKGCAVPATPDTRTLEVINYGLANGIAGTTVVTLPDGGWYGGLVLRWASNTSYIRADQATITQVNGTAVTTLAFHSTPFLAGDRMTASCNGNVITVSRNGVAVSSVTTTFNNTATYFGLVVEQSAVQVNGSPQPRAVAAMRTRRHPHSRGYWLGSGKARGEYLQTPAPKRRKVKHA
jgi:hypothetical protein